MSTITMNGTGNETRRMVAKYYADHPDATMTDQTTAKLNRPDQTHQAVVVQSYRVDGEDFVRVAGALFRLPETDGVLRAIKQKMVTVKGVSSKELVATPSTLVHDYQCVPLNALRKVPCFAANPALLKILDDVSRIADRNEAARLRFTRKSEPKSQATLFVPEPDPAPVKAEPASDLKAAVAARIAADRAAAQSSADYAAKYHDAANGLYQLERLVLEAFMLGTDAERLAALAVIAERLAK